jgi:hypothetical protein
LVVYGQTAPKTDSTHTQGRDTAIAADFEQAGRIINNLYSTIMAFENPAMAGFDRQTSGNLNMDLYGIGRKESDTIKMEPSGWSNYTMLDFAFGGKRKNVGINANYQVAGNANYSSNIINLAGSYRIHIRKVRIGVGTAMTMVKIGTADLEFRISAGIYCDWKRLMVSYSFQPLTKGIPERDFMHIAEVAHHIGLGSRFTLSPYMRFIINTSLRTGLFRNQVRSFLALRPSLLLTYKNHVYIGISSLFQDVLFDENTLNDLDRFMLEIGGQPLTGLRVGLYLSPYYDGTMQDNYGLHQLGFTVRYALTTHK